MDMATGDAVPHLLLAALASRRRARGGRLRSSQRLARFLELPPQRCQRGGGSGRGRLRLLPSTQGMGLRESLVGACCVAVPGAVATTAHHVLVSTAGVSGSNTKLGCVRTLSVGRATQSLAQPDAGSHGMSPTTVQEHNLHGGLSLRRPVLSRLRSLRRRHCRDVPPFGVRLELRLHHSG